MPLAWNEIRDRAIAFSRKYAEEQSEHAESQSFLNDFLNVFGVDRKKVAVFEMNAKKFDGSLGRVDLFWPGMLMVEMKSRGKDLEKALEQARGYFHELKDAEIPRYILVCDFERFKLFDLDPEVREDMFRDAEKVFEFKLKDLHKNTKLFSLIAGYRPQIVEELSKADIDAAELMGKLHDELKNEIKYTGHDLEVLLVRLLFCLFADNTGIFEPQGIFRDYIAQRSSEDGKDLARVLNHLFEILNEKEKDRLKSLDEQLAQFPYINGLLFQKQLRTADFTAKMRKQLLECCAFDWSEISPAIFGALFQSIMNKDARRNIGAHYTSEKNILKLIKPLFLDDLWDEFNKIKKSANKLKDFHAKLRTLKFLDPACGCGNFLVITYRELRKLEHKILKELDAMGQLELDVKNLIQLNVDQFYGIEIEEWPAQIAQVAMWLVDHQMNSSASRKFGQHFARIPLVTSATIVNGNALRIDWNTVVPKTELSYILGNPPFGGKHYQSKAQREDQNLIMHSIKSGSDLDFVACWFVKASEFVRDTKICFAFVATNSITQGEQVPLLWTYLFKSGLKIMFAHRTFQWSNEAKKMATVQCVIVGLAPFEPKTKRLFDYASPKGDPHERIVTNISPYLIEGPDAFVFKQQTPLCPVPETRCGSKPSDGGNLILTDAERDALLSVEPKARKYLKRYIGSEEFLNGNPRWCLWLDGIPPSELRSMPNVMRRVDAVRQFRLASTAEPTRKAAETPGRFFFVSQPEHEYILIPEVSSERRPFVPIGFVNPNIISSNTNYLIAKPSKYIFGVLQSTMHMAWLRTVAGRLESRYRYSGSMVYNNFPWPLNATPKQKEAIEQAAEGVLAVRKQFPNSSLADLYDPLTMPPALVKAHHALDKAVDAAYGKRQFASEAERVAFLFEEYQKLVTPLMGVENKKKKRKEAV